MEVENDTRIAELNDKFRKHGTSFTVTQGVQRLENIDEIVERVRRFNAFTQDNDPWGEHDFGAIMVSGRKVFWKIDYYDNELKYGKDPLDPSCNRVLTIMLASEY